MVTIKKPDDDVTDFINKTHQLQSGVAGSVLDQSPGSTVDSERVYPSLAVAGVGLVAEALRRLLDVDPSRRTFYRDALALTYPSASEQQHRSEIEALKVNLERTKQKLKAHREGREAAEKDAARLQDDLEELRKKLALSFVLDRIHEEAKPVLIASDSFRQCFLDEAPCDAFVIAIDIRRSTDLMLKAREAKLYATFIVDLCSKLRKTILEHAAVFDKFTGDGILAYFPDFYSGKDAGYRAFTAADACHRVFAEHYYNHRRSFLAVSSEAGLGIGIDRGKLTFVQVGGELAVVGAPVVYACRLSNADAGSTLLNQAAHDEIFDRYSAYCFVEETKRPAKHEGDIIAYTVRGNGKALADPAPPAWRRYAAEVATEVDDKGIGPSST